jgi:hypothetical protein
VKWPKLPSGRTVLLAAMATLVVASFWNHKKEESADVQALEAVLANMGKQLKDAQAVIAKKDAELSDFKNLREASKALAGKHGKLVAGVTITIPERDTVLVHDTLKTTVLSDSTRIGSFEDSTFAGKLRLVVKAPPCCGPLVLDSLKVTRPEFSPEVGFVKVGSHYVAIVAWQGEEFKIKTAFFDPDPAKPTKRFVSWLEGTYNLGSAHEVRGGASMRLGKFQIGPSVSQRLSFGERPALGVTVRKEF